MDRSDRILGRYWLFDTLTSIVTAGKWQVSMVLVGMCPLEKVQKNEEMCFWLLTDKSLTKG